MKRYLSDNQEGYSLLLTLIIIVLFSILGVSLIAMSFNGTTKNEIREDIVQSSDLASKGIEHANAQITKELNEAVTASGISAVEYVNKLNSVVDKYKCSGNKSITGQATSGAGTNYTVCIFKSVDDSESMMTINSTQKYLRKIITFKSTGISGDKSNILYAKYNIGSTQYPEVLNYAVGAYKVKDKSDTTRFPPIPGEGNLYLNGGVTIKGDLKVDNDLIVSKRGIWKSGSTAISEESLYPEISGVDSRNNSKLFLGGNLYHFTHPARTKENWNYKFTYDDYIDGKDIGNTSYYSKYTDDTKLFFNEIKPKRVNQFVDIKPIDFTSKKVAIYFDSNNLNSYKNKLNDFKFSNIVSSSDVYLATTYVTNEKVDSKCKKNCEMKVAYKYDNDYVLSGTNIFGKPDIKNSGKFATSGNLSISAESTTFNNGAYVGGNLNITGNTAIKGIIYVKGNLTITNANLDSDAIFYVDGTVTITKSVIAGIVYKDASNEPKKNRIGSLIIFSKGDIKLSNNSEYQSTASDFKAYFYSEKTMELYGVGSNIIINGGISARKIILNAVRGDTQPGRSCFFCNSSLDVDNISDQKKKDSRLQIIYNPEIIRTYSELDIDEEPWINNISPPIELERSYNSP
ncbi:hypothetical protein [Planococcus versutus]|uniref:Type 4 fimbrial biogenesis protein PilX N-terminal domain-containing protein n=1 Tax=Planococcus versutus TaxID=1302659 RepID=A0A1B1RXJ3_9BACL|nr:hypothetical protein [Planococcus versutus]ANU25653.1 hypothetical protein I858_000990 [Planococcus versutus]